MSLIVNGVEVQAINVIQGGVTTALNELICNGTSVWQGTKWNTIAEGTFGAGGRQTGGSSQEYAITASDMGLVSFDTSLPTRITGTCNVAGTTVATFTETELYASGTYKYLYNGSTQTFQAKLDIANSQLKVKMFTNATKVLNITITKVEQFY